MKLEFVGIFNAISETIPVTPNEEALELIVPLVMKVKLPRILLPEFVNKIAVPLPAGVMLCPPAVLVILIDAYCETLAILPNPVDTVYPVPLYVYSLELAYKVPSIIDKVIKPAKLIEFGVVVVAPPPTKLVLFAPVTNDPFVVIKFPPIERFVVGI